MATQSLKSTANSITSQVSSQVISEDRSQYIQRLMQQLDQVNQAAIAGFWLTTAELAALLDLEDEMIHALQTQVKSLRSASGQFLNLSHRFLWRNFECVLVDCELDLNSPNVKNLKQETAYWQIKKTPANPVALPSEFPPQNLELNKRSPQPQALTIGSPIVSSPEPEIIPSPFAIIDNFLPPDQLKALLNYSINKQSQFIPTTNSANDPNYRRSFFLHQFPEFSELMIGLIRDIKPQVIAHLGIPDFKVGQIETQITAHNHGNYYKIHNDSGSPDSATRVLTYVYYYHREPKAFTGGELVIYDSKVENGYYVAASSYKTVQPTNNTIVFFPSKCMHEVLPVSCPSEYFANSRFTVNGWLRKA